MNTMSNYRTWVSTRAKLPPVPIKVLTPARPYAEQAKRDCAAVAKSWDQMASKFNSDKAVVEARRLEWLEMLPDGAFGRAAAAEIWGVSGGSGDSRLEVLERLGLIQRVAVKPIQWVKA